MTNPNDHDPNSDQVFIADPSTADIFDDEPTLPKWPKVVGIISICFASLGLICGGVGTAWMFIQPGFMKSAEANMPGGFPPELTQSNPTLIAATIIGTAWAAFLLVCGIMCVLRKPKVRPLFLLYAVIAILLTIWSASIQLELQAGVKQWVADHPDAQFSDMSRNGAQGIGQFIGLIVGLAISFSWPAFCLFWFGFVKTKPDDFTGGANIEVL